MQCPTTMMIDIQQFISDCSVRLQLTQFLVTCRGLVSESSLGVLGRYVRLLGGARAMAESCPMPFACFSGFYIPRSTFDVE